MSRLKVVGLGLGLVLLAGCDSDPQLQTLNDELQTIRQQAQPLAPQNKPNYVPHTACKYPRAHLQSLQARGWIIIPTLRIVLFFQ